MPAVNTTVVAEARDPVQAEIWLDALHAAGIEANAFERGVGAALGGATGVFAIYPVVVAESDLVRARNVIAELGDAARISPVRDHNAARSAQRRGLTIAGALIILIVILGVLSRVVVG